MSDDQQIAIHIISEMGQEMPLSPIHDAFLEADSNVLTNGSAARARFCQYFNSSADEKQVYDEEDERKMEEFIQLDSDIRFELSTDGHSAYITTPQLTVDHAHEILSDMKWKIIFEDEYPSFISNVTTNHDVSSEWRTDYVWFPDYDLHEHILRQKALQ